MATLLRVENLTKRFGNVVANDRLSLEVREGEVHALLGENGAGKSTLMNMLYGLAKPDEGTIFWKGETITLVSPREAIRHGIGMVHQHFIQVASLSVLENVVLGERSGLIGDMAAAEQRLRKLSAEFHQDIDPHAIVGTLSVGEQQRVEILKALYRNVNLLILDEPTASLTPAEVQQLFAVCRALVAKRRSVILITHKLDEVLELSDRLTVLRHGRTIATQVTAGSRKEQLARLMVGEDIVFEIEKAACATGTALLEVANLSAQNDRHRTALADVSFTLRRGEILGIAGVDGNGQAELVETILGVRRPLQGTIHLSGKDITPLGVSARLQASMAIVPGDRHAQAIAQNLSMLDNAILGFSESRNVARSGFLSPARVRRFTESIIADFHVKVASPASPMRTLSGGHQQRFVLGRALRHDASLLIAVQPTRGLDLISSDFVRRKLIELRDAGNAVLLISMDLDEVQMLSDRICVMYAGRISGQATAPYDRETLGLWMAGSPAKSSATARPN